MAQPEKTFRIGACSASVFVNTRTRDEDQTERTFRTVSLQRSYRDGDQWKTSSSFTLADLPNAMEVMRMALNHVAAKEGSANACT